MSHPKARLTVHGRLLLVHRVTVERWAVVHAVKAMGIPRQCAHRWLNRYRERGETGLVDRSSAPHHHPNRTPLEVEHQVLRLRREQRRGPDWSAARMGLPARTVTRILHLLHMPHLHEIDPLTGTVIRASKTTTIRYERDHPGSLVHTDVKKIGRISDAGGWRLPGRQMVSTAAGKKLKLGYGYVCSVVDDHSRYAYTEILDDETAATTAGFLARALAVFADAGFRERQPVVIYAQSCAGRVAGAARDQACVHPSTVPGRTGKWNGSTGPCKPSGPIGSPSEAIKNALTHLSLAPPLQQ